MRITKIRTLKDFGEWLVDQLLHGLIGWLPVVAFAQRIRDQAIAAAVILTIREVEQARDTIEEWWLQRRDFATGRLDPCGDERCSYCRGELTVRTLLRDLHLPDRFGDVGAGTLAACGLWTLGQLIWRALA